MARNRPIFPSKKKCSPV